MIIISDIDLRNFGFWSGGKDTAKTLTLEEIDQIQFILEDSYPDGMTETDVNDFFWFERDTIAYWLGYTNWEELEQSR